MGGRGELHRKLEEGLGLTNSITAAGALTRNLKNLGQAAHNQAALYCGWGEVVYSTFFSLDSINKTKKNKMNLNPKNKKR